MDRQQTGNLLIGAGILAGLGTFAYWYLSGGTAAAETQSGGTATKPAKPPDFYKQNVMQPVVWSSLEERKRAYVASKASYTPGLYE